MTKPREFAAISVQFTQNLRTLRIFIEDIGEHAEAHDRQTIARITGLIE